MRSAFLAAAFLLAPLPAAAQGNAFTLGDSASCGVVFASIGQALEDGAEAPESFRAQVLLGIDIWRYELASAAPGDLAAQEEAARIANDGLEAAMPTGEGPDAAGERGALLMERAVACGEMIDRAYPNDDHPVVRQLQARAAALSEGGGEARERGLR